MRVTSSGSSSSRVARIPMKLEREREWEKRRSAATMDASQRPRGFFTLFPCFYQNFTT